MMKKGEVWNPVKVVDKGVGEDCVICEIKKTETGAIVVEVRVNAYNIDKKGDCYSGQTSMVLTNLRAKKEGV